MVSRKERWAHAQVEAARAALTRAAECRVIGDDLGARGYLRLAGLCAARAGSLLLDLVEDDTVIGGGVRS